MCGIVAITGSSNAAAGPQLYDALSVLQHRGQDAAGIATDDHGRLALRKDNGLVADVFRQKHMNRLAGGQGIGHCRYPTAGCPSNAEAQPFYVNAPYGLALAHNGNLTNTAELVEDLRQSDRRHLNTTSDSEVLLNIFAHELQQKPAGTPLADAVFDACDGVRRRCRGAYAVTGLVMGHGVFALRDPLGIRPLVIGRRETLQGVEHMIASESVALDALGFELLDDVGPGEAVWADAAGQLVRRPSGAAHRPPVPCIFEHVYLARPDSMMDGVSVYKARLRMGEKLADKVFREASRLGIQSDNGKPAGIDVVMPIPDSGRTAALSMAARLGVPYREGFIKNRYVGRTFIMPGQAERRKSVRKKLNPIPLEFAGKTVCLVDDSIVRGTTCTQIIKLAREAGAKRVVYCSAAPPVRFPNVYGIDMPAPEELIAHGRTTEQVAEEIGADWLVYQDLADLVACSREGNPQIERFDCSVFDGVYPTGDIDAGYLEGVREKRNDAAQTAALASR
ncbi:amidophosphoribosyltransferase [Phycisphaera mikurensis]|uniref:Amidophosphoribosyltransferase n=1 Tax=Phycisphaera mikurensis (strain NBRC 102666 / KCTC 22515 / FYK2301M01) TaxID=1142394 RepID=I0IF65_PHYMF|nr:amidophosphoribosyltransferase [Phycisphaera mikurensis]MBB6440701.1 amidophosphoribosyltransferase [Phycisphaera mikurensis]BAM03903.1 amidophosphoribosyltransferase [Phycisphaera mikurensis NBRC 102666]